MYMDIQIKITFQFVIQYPETVAHLRKPQFNKDNFPLIHRFVFMRIVRCRQSLIQKFVLSFSSQIFFGCFYRRKLLDLFSPFPVYFFHHCYSFTHTFSPSESFPVIFLSHDHHRHS